MPAFDDLQKSLRNNPRRWLITGVGGFIGSHLLETLLGLDQEVTGLDNFATGRRSNLELVRAAVSEEQWSRFKMVEESITDIDACHRACQGVELILHQAALGSVPRSIDNPLASHDSNVTGTANMLFAAKEEGVARFVYASSSSVYGDEPNLPKVEDRIGSPASPYAATKRIDEIYAKTFAQCYGIETIGLRYFNIFGPRQDPEGAYAAVVPKWTASMLQGEPVFINGTGETSRDFCYVTNAVQANLLAATCTEERAINEVFNVALHDQMNLNELFSIIRDAVGKYAPELSIPDAEYKEFRAGDIMHSLADIRKAKKLLGYEPTYTAKEGLAITVDWFCRELLASA